MIQTAVILAAGQGKRFQNLENIKHKSLIKFEDVSLLELSISKLLSTGIKKIVVVVGHEEATLRETLLPSSFNEIIFISNPDFNTAGNLISLIMGIGNLDGPCLLLDADILYEKKALDLIVSQSNKNGFLTAKPSNSGDEVFVKTVSGKVKHISKYVNPDDKSDCSEYVGITFLSAEVVFYLQKLDITEFRSDDYESFINKELLDRFDFEEIYLADLIWSEVDCENDWNRIEGWGKTIKSKLIIV